MPTSTARPFASGRSACLSRIAGSLLAVNLMVLVSATPATAGHWSHDFESAEARARREGRPLIVHFSATWCGPCRRMEAETLHRPGVGELLDSSVGVMVDIDARADLKSRFNVKMMPTDVVVAPNGTVVFRREGFADLAGYRSSIEPALAMATPPRTRPPQPQPGRPRADRSQLASQAGGESGRAADRSTPPARSRTNPTPMMRGFSVIALHDRREWVKGSDEFAADHRGQRYLFCNEDERQQFLQRPRLYTPRLLGCDAVLFQRDDRALLGSVDFAAFYGSELFLFIDDETRRMFKADPDAFMATRMVTVEEIESVTR